MAARPAGVTPPLGTLRGSAPKRTGPRARGEHAAPLSWDARRDPPAWIPPLACFSFTNIHGEILLMAGQAVLRFIDVTVSKRPPLERI